MLNLLEENKNIINSNANTLLQPSKEIGQEPNINKTKYMIITEVSVTVCNKSF